MIRRKHGFADLKAKTAPVFDVKATGADGEIEGYGSVFNVVDSYREAVLPGAFVNSLVKRKSSGIRMLWQHNMDEPIGVWTDIAEDSKGLYVKGRLLVGESDVARKAYGLLKAKALDGLSIGYREIKTEPHPDKSGVLNLVELDLREISVVTFAANEKARVDTVKSILDRGDSPTVREFEKFLRDAGFSKSQAAAIASKAAPYLRGDPDETANSVRLLKLLGDDQD
jgi:HK97 family phage prohead protease